MPDMNRYIDLVDIIQRAGGENYSDFEGMASDEHTRWLLAQEPVRNMLDSFHDLVVGEALEHLLAHWAYENQDQGDYKVTVADALLAIDLMAMILDCRYWMKVQ